MCHICKDRFSVQEKIAAHDYVEQMREFYGLQVKEPKKRRLTKKSLLARIEHELSRLQDESVRVKLQELVVQPLDDLAIVNEKFESVMRDYYREMLKDEANAS